MLYKTGYLIEKQIKELEEFFKKAKLPVSIHPDEGNKIIDIPLFIKSHTEVLRFNGDKALCEVFYWPLLRLKEILLIKA